MQIEEIDGDVKLEQSFEIMKQLRTELDRDDYRRRFPELRRSGYRLFGLSDGGELSGLAGYRIVEGGYGWKRYLYVEELVVRPDRRSNGHGAALLEFLKEVARRESCHHIRLDSGVHRHAAHRFYLRNRFDVTHHHFRIAVAE